MHVHLNYRWLDLTEQTEERGVRWVLGLCLLVSFVALGMVAFDSSEQQARQRLAAQQMHGGRCVRLLCLASVLMGHFALLLCIGCRVELLW